MLVFGYTVRKFCTEIVLSGRLEGNFFGRKNYNRFACHKLIGSASDLQMCVSMGKATDCKLALRSMDEDLYDIVLSNLLLSVKFKMYFSKFHNKTITNQNT